MVKTAYVWDNITAATRELEEYLNSGYTLLSSTLYEEQESENTTTLIFAAVLVKEGN